jgi:molecular chaperone DnaJ
MATMSRDYYEVLGVSREATADEIKKAYRRLAREKHPDVNAHRRDEAEAEFKELGQAYAALSDEQKRARYDRFGPEGVNGAPGPDFSGGGMGDIFDVFFGGGGGGSPFGGGGVREQVRRGGDLRLNVQLTLEEIWSGVTRDLEIPTRLRCTGCEGSGAAPGTSDETCTACKGAGRLREVRQTFFGQFAQEVPCARCGGRGRVIPTPCPTCRGEGRVKGKRNVSVQIPAGVDEGDRVRVTGAGEDGEAGSPPGDLYCVIYVQEHRQFERHEFDSLLVVPLSFAQAALGDLVTVPTLERNAAGEPVTAEVAIPAGTQTGAQFRISDKGFSDRYGRRGDQICIARVVVPTKMTERQKDLLREFAEISDEHPEEHPRGFFSKIKDVFGVE